MLSDFDKGIGNSLKHAVYVKITDYLTFTTEAAYPIRSQQMQLGDLSRSGPCARPSLNPTFKVMKHNIIFDHHLFSV